MLQLEVEEAGACLEELIDRALAGERITIARDGRAVVMLVPIEAEATPLTD